MGQRTVYFCDICEVELKEDDLWNVPSVNSAWSDSIIVEYDFTTAECCESCRNKIAKAILEEKKKIQSKEN